MEAMFAKLFANGRIIDFVLVFVLLEALALMLLHRRTGRGVAPEDFLLNLLSGAGLMLALRFALGGAWWGFIALSLMAALSAHLADLAIRWNRDR